MKESAWLACREPLKLLEWLQDSGRASDRKLRLFAVACCRRIWHLLAEGASRRAVEVAERFADGLADSRALAAARGAARAADDRRDPAARAAKDTTRAVAGQAAWNACYHAAGAAAGQVGVAGSMQGGSDTAWDAECECQAAILRDLFGPLPFRTVKAMPTWRTPAVLALAASIDDEHRFDETPVLADALEEAGCDNAELLEHLRRPGPHVRGCYALDFVLGKS